MPGQIINFTFPHIGNVGTNDEDIETSTTAARGSDHPHGHHGAVELARHPAPDAWLKARNLIGIAGIDTCAPDPPHP